MIKPLVAMGCAIAVATTGCSREAERDPYVTAGTVSSGEAHFVRRQFEEYATYLRGLGAIAADTSLVLLSGKETFTCREPAGVKSHRKTSLSFSDYCPGNNAVVVTGLTMNTWLGGRRYSLAAGRAAIRLTLAHEFGHAEQDHASELNSQTTNTAEQPAIELQATCFAGEIIQHFDPTDVAATAQILRETPMMGPDHGSSQAQADAWLQGARTGSCASFMP